MKLLCQVDVIFWNSSLTFSCVLRELGLFGSVHWIKTNLGSIILVMHINLCKILKNSKLRGILGPVDLNQVFT